MPYFIHYLAYLQFTPTCELLLQLVVLEVENVQLSDWLAKCEEQDVRNCYRLTDLFGGVLLAYGACID